MESSGLADSDAEVLNALHAEHGAALHAFALRLTSGDSGRAEELVQETLLRAWQRPAAPEPGRGSVRGWLFTIARNLAVDAWRRRRARPAEVVTDSLPEPASSQHADHADRAVESWLIEDALARLSTAHREVLVACFYRGESIAGCAARLGVPPGTVKSRVHYALRSLRLALEEMGVTR